MASPQAAIVTGGLKGHVLLVQVEGGGQGALGLVCAHRAAAQQRIGALSSASGLCGGFGRELVKLKAASGDSGDAWLVEPDHYYQGRLSTARCSRRAIRAAQGCKKYLLAPPVRHQTPQPGSSWLRPRLPSSPAVVRATLPL